MRVSETSVASPASVALTTPGLTVAAVARRLGVAPATLRTWDRRYGLGPSSHSAGAHRRYSTVDVARLDLMRRLVNAGAPPGEAARAALETDVRPDSAAAPVLEPRDDAAEADVDTGLADVDLAPLLAQITGAPGGGHVISLPSGSPAVRGLARAAMSLDSVACTEIVRDMLDRRGVVWTWDHMLSPVLVGIGRQWADNGRGVEVEHMLSESIISALAGVTSRLRRPVNPRPVLLASAEEELHSLPLFAVAAALAERHVGSRVLGARVPHDALAGAIRRTGPCVVLVWSSLQAPGSAAALATLPSMRPAPLVLAAGPGWGRLLPEGVAPVTDLVDAVTRICATAIV
jgi:DNA-binding transcriptional MerR regulator